MMNDVGHIGHVGGQIVRLRLRLDMKIAGCAIDVEEAGDLAARMVFVVPGVFDFVSAGRESTG